MLDRFVGLPYVEGGRDWTGTDCWGIVRLYLREAYGIELPSYDGPTIRHDHPDLMAARAGDGPWRQVEVPRAGDLGLWKRPRRELHAGVLVAPGMVLHNDSLSRGSAIVRVRDVIGGRPEWWRHEALG